MNNQQFRRLVLDNSSTPARQDGTPSSATLGSRQRSSIPMTPRSVGGVDFARQLREQQRGGMPPPAKRFKSSAAPKGSRLAAGYTDRSQALREGAEQTDADDKERRIRALEEQVKLGQISEELFAKLRDEIIGGDVGSVHLVKGLDRRLLERVRRGEDVFEGRGDGEKDEEQERAPEEGNSQEEEGGGEEDVDAAFDALEQEEVAPLTAEQRAQRDALPQKRSRNDILRELKAARAASGGAPAQQGLGSRFKKVGDKLKPGTSRLEVDARGREVLVTVDADGNVKRKVRKAKPEVAAERDTSKSDVKPQVLGADVVIPEARKKVEEEEDDGDIFGGVGADYNPLAELEGEAKEDDSDSDSASDEPAPQRGRSKSRSRSRSRSYSSRSRSDSRSRSAPRRRLRSHSRSHAGSRTRRRRRSYSSSLSRSRTPPRRRRSYSDSRSQSRSPRHSSRSPVERQAAAPQQAATAAPRNYFGQPSGPSTVEAPANPLADPGMLEALKRAARIAKADELNDDDPAVRERAEAEAARLRRRREMLANVDRDAQDLDEGFGASRGGDDEEESKVKLSEWGAEDGTGERNERGGGQKRKRGKKKRKGDGNSVADVMAAVARRKG